MLHCNCLDILQSCENDRQEGGVGVKVVVGKGRREVSLFLLSEVCFKLLKYDMCYNFLKYVSEGCRSEEEEGDGWRVVEEVVG